MEEKIAANYVKFCLFIQPTIANALECGCLGNGECCGFGHSGCVVLMVVVVVVGRMNQLHSFMPCRLLAAARGSNRNFALDSSDNNLRRNGLRVHGMAIHFR